LSRNGKDLYEYTHKACLLGLRKKLQETVKYFSVINILH